MADQGSGVRVALTVAAAAASAFVVYKLISALSSNNKKKAASAAAGRAAAGTTESRHHVVREPENYMLTKTLSQRRALATRLRHDDKVPIVIEELARRDVFRKISAVAKSCHVDSAVFERAQGLLGLEEQDVFVFVLISVGNGRFSLMPITRTLELDVGTLHEQYALEDGFCYFVLAYPGQRSAEFYAAIKSGGRDQAVVQAAQRRFFKAALKEAVHTKRIPIVNDLLRLSAPLCFDAQRLLTQLSEKHAVDEQDRQEWMDIECGAREVLGIPSRIEIDTENILDSSIDALVPIPVQRMRAGLYVKYTSSIGQGAELGVDQGGVFRDWLLRLSEVLFSPQQHFVIETTCTELGKTFVSLSPYEQLLASRGMLPADRLESVHKLIGWVLGLSVKFKVPIGVRLAPHFAKQLLRKPYDLKDLRYVREGEYKVYSKLLDPSLSESEHQVALVEVIEMLGELTYEVTSREVEVKQLIKEQREQQQAQAQALKETARPTLQRQTSVDSSSPSRESSMSLSREPSDRPGMLTHQMSVVGSHDNPSAAIETVEDATRFVQDLAQKYLVDNVQPQLDQVVDAFQGVVAAQLDELTTEVVMHNVLGITTLRVSDWKRHTTVSPSHYRNAKQLKWLWEFVETLTEDEREQLLYWWTGYRTLPTGGFQALPNGGPTINFIARLGNFLPNSHTCMLQLDLPLFETQDELKAKLGEALKHVNFGIL